MEWLPIGFVLGLAVAWFFRRRPASPEQPEPLEQPELVDPTPPAPPSPHGRWRHPHA